MNTDGSYKLDDNGDRIYDFGSYRPSGSMANWNLPATLPLDKSERMKDEFSGRTYLEATIIEGLKFKTSFNFDLINYNTLDYTNPKIGPALENGGGSSRLNSRTFHGHGTTSRHMIKPLVIITLMCLPEWKPIRTVMMN